jgi:hypothetical protein
MYVYLFAAFWSLALRLCGVALATVSTWKNQIHFFDEKFKCTFTFAVLEFLVGCRKTVLRRVREKQRVVRGARSVLQQ